MIGRLSAARAFLLVADAGTFAEAARRLGVGTGQVSKLVARLEAELDVRLLNRTTRAVSLTEAGEIAVARVRPLLEGLDGLAADIRERAGPSGRLRLSLPVTFGRMWLLAPLLELATRHPALSLDLVFDDRRVALVEEGFDGAVRIGPAQDSALLGRRLCDARIVVVAAPALVARLGTPPTPQQLGTWPCVLDTNFRDPARWSFRTPLSGAPVSVTVPGRLRLSGGETALAAAVAGLGAARLPSFLAGPELAVGRLTLLLAAWEEPPREVLFLHPAGRYVPAKVRVAADALAAALHPMVWDVGW